MQQGERCCEAKASKAMLRCAVLQGYVEMRCEAGLCRDVL